MKKIILSLLFTTSIALSAQIGGSTQIGNSKWTFGGNAGISGGFGSNSGFGISVAPRVGYKISENVEAGISSGFNFLNTDYYSSTLFGIGPFANYYFGRNFYLNGQFQEYIINQKDKTTGQRHGFDEAALYLGGGYMTRVGNNAYMQLGAMYNVLWKENNSIFSSGFAPQIGVVFGL